MFAGWSGGNGEVEGRREIGGKSAMVVGGIDAPGHQHVMDGSCVRLCFCLSVTPSSAFRRAPTRPLFLPRC